jgi:hypothetical protein
MKSLDLMWAQLLGTGKGLSDSGRFTALAIAACGGGAQQFNAARRGPAKNYTLVESRLHRLRHAHAHTGAEYQLHQSETRVNTSCHTIGVPSICKCDQLTKVSQRAGPLLNFPMNEPTLQSCFLNSPE